MRFTPLLSLSRTVVVLGSLWIPTQGQAVPMDDPETVIRALVRANAELDFPTISRYIAHDADIVSYTIGGRKYVGWEQLASDLKEEFSLVRRLELPIRELKVWRKGDVAWFTMELDYIRHLRDSEAGQKEVLPLRESGVLEHREGRWQLLSWHESMRSLPGVLSSFGSSHAGPRAKVVNTESPRPDLSGQWEITEVEDDKHYRATLDRSGNGPYTQHEGRFVTTRFVDRLWQGTWHQPGNDREGGFELLLSEDGKEAKGVWWYSRVGNHKNIPPREHGGTYLWKRLPPVPDTP